MDDKVYTPIVVEDAPFPQQDPVSTNTTQQTSNQTYGANTQPEALMPHPVIARETVSSSLNTHSKKILQEYQFTKNGAIQVGEFQEGLSGDIRISPDGLVARNKDGNVTVAIDGDTGDAQFAGTLQAGTLIGGDNTVVIEEGASGGGRIVFYNNGVPSIIIGDPT